MNIAANKLNYIYVNAKPQYKKKTVCLGVDSD